MEVAGGVAVEATRSRDGHETGILAFRAASSTRRDPGTGNVDNAHKDL